MNRAVSSGAITIEEATESGLRESELGGRSFRQVLHDRQSA
jgi:hypothetical protein